MLKRLIFCRLINCFSMDIVLLSLEHYFNNYDLHVGFFCIDRTVKIWNLKSCTELLTLDKHFSYVRCVRFCPKNNIIFTASQSLIKVSSYLIVFVILDLVYLLVMGHETSSS